MEMLLTVEQAAERLQLTPYTVRAQLRQGKLRGIRRGRVWRIEESALLESTPAPRPKAARRAFGLLASDSNATGKRTVDDFSADRRAELPETEAVPDLDVLFAPPTPEEIGRRLAALEAFGSATPSTGSKNAKPITNDAVAQGYDERAAQLMEGHR